MVCFASFSYIFDWSEHQKWISILTQAYAACEGGVRLTITANKAGVSCAAVTTAESISMAFGRLEKIGTGGSITVETERTWDSVTFWSILPKFDANQVVDALSEGRGSPLDHEKVQQAAAIVADFMKGCDPQYEILCNEPLSLPTEHFGSVIKIASETRGIKQIYHSPSTSCFAILYEDGIMAIGTPIGMSNKDRVIFDLDDGFGVASTTMAFCFPEAEEDRKEWIASGREGPILKLKYPLVKRA
jgi:hypothetical protein